MKTIRNSPSGKLKPVTPPTSILWRPDGTGDVATWSEVMDAVADSQAPITIWVEEAVIHAIPPSAVVYDMNHATIQAPIGNHGLTEVGIQTGAVLHNLAGITGGFVLSGNPQTGPCLTFTTRTFPDDPPVFSITQNAAIKNNGAVPLIQYAGDGAGAGEFYLVFDRFSGVENGSGAPIINVTATGKLLLTCTNGPDFEDGGFPVQSFGSSDNTALAIWVHDGTLAFLPASGPAGPSGAFDSFAAELNYPLGVSGGSGPLTFRPGLVATPPLGCMYFATDYVGVSPSGSALWWAGAAWQDSVGVVVP